MRESMVDYTNTTEHYQYKHKCKGNHIYASIIIVIIIVIMVIIYNFTTSK